MSDFYNPISHKFLWILNLGGLGDCEPELLVSGNYFSVRLHSGQTTGHARDLSPFRDPSGGQSWKTTAHASLATQSAGKSRLKQQIPNVKSITERWRYFVEFFYMALRVFTFQNALFIFVGLRLVVIIAETFERQGILFILLTLLYCA